MTQPTLKAFGEHALLLEWDKKISEDINEEILQMDGVLSEIFSNEILETVPTYNALALYLKRDISVEKFASELKNELANVSVNFSEINHRTVIVPVCYDAEFALDIEDVAQRNDLSVEDVIRLHTAKTYRVYFLGFLPGFPYLGGMDEKLATPRKAAPREKVAKGSVGIGAGQTGIYTVNSPGGWNIVGKSALPFFNVKKNPISLLRAGDFVKLKAVSKNEFKKIEIEVATDIYKLEVE